MNTDSADLMVVNRFISNMVLGNDSVKAFAPPARSASNSGVTLVFRVVRRRPEAHPGVYVRLPYAGCPMPMERDR